MAAFVRTLLRMLDWLPTAYLVGAVLIWSRPQDRRLGDVNAERWPG